jgi:hypothetical protein
MPPPAVRPKLKGPAMDLLTIVRVVLRRWYITGPVVVMTLIAAFIMQGNVPSQFRASGSILITDPQFDPSRLPDPGAVVEEATVSVQDPETLDELAPGPSDVAFGMVGNATVEAVATAESPREAERIARSALVRLADEVAEVQAGDQSTLAVELQPNILTPSIIAEQVDETRFRASGRIQLIDPTLENANPYTASGATVRLLQVAVMSDVGRARVSELTGQQVTYQVSSEAYDAAPIMGVEIFGADPTAVIGGFDAIKAFIGEELERRQERAAVPIARRLTVEALAQPQSVIDESPPLDRIVAVVMALGLAAALGLALAVESFAQRRRNGRTASAEDSPYVWSSADLDFTAAGDEGDQPLQPLAPSRPSDDD